MKPILKQSVSVNGGDTLGASNQGDIFSLLSSAQDAIQFKVPDLDDNWLAKRPNILTIIGTLLHCGKVSIFSLEDKLRVDIRWEWEMRSAATLGTDSDPTPAGHCAFCGSADHWGSCAGTGNKVPAPDNEALHDPVGAARRFVKESQREAVASPERVYERPVPLAPGLESIMNEDPTAAARQRAADRYSAQKTAAQNQPGE